MSTLGLCHRLVGPELLKLSQHCQRSLGSTDKAQVQGFGVTYPLITGDSVAFQLGTHPQKYQQLREGSLVLSRYAPLRVYRQKLLKGLSQTSWRREQSQTGRLISSPFTLRVTNFAEAELGPNSTYGGETFTRFWHFSC